MLKRIRLKDFKSFVDEEVEIAPLTLLVGANASGKSNFLDAIRFLKGLVSGLTLSEVLNGEQRSGPKVWSGIRGRADETARVGSKEFRIESLWSVSKAGVKSASDYGEADQFHFQHWVACRTSPVAKIEGEGVDVERDDDRDDDWARDGRLYPPVSSGDRSLLGRTRRSREISGNISFLRIDPDAMHDYGRRGEPLGEDGRNVSGVLAEICDDPDDKMSLVTWLAELCAPEIEGIDFLEVKDLGDVMAMFVEGGGKRISARSISDGTLHFLGTLLALRTSEPGSIILIEEIEAGLHPTRIRLLVEYLEAVTRERQIQVIATTHSPVMLQWLSDESLRNTIVFGRVPDHEGTIMRRLGDLPHFNEVVERTGIEEMFTTGWLEMAL
ncbi:MAG TPA: AAA family ATPase [Thermoanaerobaculia bacterium]